MSATLENGSAAPQRFTSPRSHPLRTCSGGKSLAGVLVDEIERVTILRERHRVLGETVGNVAGFLPALAMMTLSLDLAKRAIDRSDLVAQIASYRELRGYDDE